MAGVIFIVKYITDGVVTLSQLVFIETLFILAAYAGYIFSTTPFQFSEECK